eukprot:XP_016661357.1 PREDICTED: interleukin-1 receptor-associated kinase 1-like [Acyrthosiphon pisum]
MYDVQKSVWVTPNDRLQFAPSLTTKRGIEDVLEQYHNPRYPNFNFPKPQKSRKQRRPPINIELLNQQDNQLAIGPPPSPVPSSSTTLPFKSSPTSLPIPSMSHSYPSTAPGHSSVSTSPLNWSSDSPDSPDSPLFQPIFSLNDLPVPSSSSPGPSTSSPGGCERISTFPTT